MTQAWPILDFFSWDAERVLSALPLLEASSGAVTSTETLFRPQGAGGLRGHRGGIFSEAIFGSPREGGRFGHLDVVGVVHPAAYGELAGVLGWGEADAVQRVACGELALRGTRLVDAEETEEGDLTGATALAAALSRAAPGHRCLPLCGLRRVPVPPPVTRPLARPDGAEAVDPWIGPLNERWLRLVECSVRERRLVELDAPPVLQRAEAGQLQRALEAVIGGTLASKLVPPLLGAPAALEREDPVAIAFVDEQRLVVQRSSLVAVVSASGEVRRVCPPAACRLHGVLEGRYAFFEGYLAHPAFDAELSFSAGRMRRDQAGLSHFDWEGEISVLDCDTGEYLEVAPGSVPRHWVRNEQPEDLFVGPLFEEVDPQRRDGWRRLRVGDDRPQLLACTDGLRFAWAGEGRSTAVVSLETGLPVVLPAQPDSSGRVVDLTGRGTGGVDEDDPDWACAATFTDGTWWFLWPEGTLANQLAESPVRLTPPPRAAAFDPAGHRLALVVDREIVVLERRTLEVVGRLPLPEAG